MNARHTMPNEITQAEIVQLEAEGRIVLALAMREGDAELQDLYFAQAEAIATRIDLLRARPGKAPPSDGHDWWKDESSWAPEELKGKIVHSGGTTPISASRKATLRASPCLRCTKCGVATNGKYPFLYKARDRADFQKKKPPCTKPTGE